MPHELFLSHDSRDKEKSEVLAQTITRATLDQIVVWHSSDATATGGLRPGNVWLDEIRRRLASSKAVVVLLTPISLSRPWLLFESGFGAAQSSCDVIPVCIGVDSGTDVPFPLAMYQAYQLSDYDSLKRFAAKLFANYDIKFDEQMCRPVLEECVQKLAQSNEESLAPKKRPEPTLSDAIFELKEHLDIRLFSLLGSTSYTGLGRYNVEIDLRRNPDVAVVHLEVGDDTSVQDVLDNVYHMLGGEVRARTYLEEWVLRDASTLEHLIVREIQSRIPARAIFKPSSRWQVIRLQKPYTATETLKERGEPPAERVAVI